MAEELDVVELSVGGEFLGVVPLTSVSGLLLPFILTVAEVGVLISMGSPGDGADIWIVGVGIGTIRTPIASSGIFVAKRDLCGLSVAVAICATVSRTKSARAQVKTDAGVREHQKEG